MKVTNVTIKTKKAKSDNMPGPYPKYEVNSVLKNLIIKYIKNPMLKPPATNITAFPIP